MKPIYLNKIFLIKNTKILSSNVYLIKDEDFFVAIDLGSNLDYIEKNIRKKIKYAIVTHGHFDHCANGKVFDFDVYIKKEELECNGVFPYPFFSNKFKIINFNKIKIGNFLFKIIDTPGHSVSSICLYEEDKKILFSGDTIFEKGIFGRTDLYKSSEIQLKNSLKKIYDLKIDYLFPGH